MVKLNTEEELLATFRPVDLDEVQMPADLQFPLIVRDYVSWTEPSGHRTYLVFEDGARKGNLLGVVFQRTQSGADLPAAMCDWCHSVRGGGAVTLMTATASNKRRVGLTICRDLSCKEKIIGPPGVNDVRESMPTQAKLQRLVTRMTEFARRNLF